MNSTTKLLVFGGLAAGAIYLLSRNAAGADSGVSAMPYLAGGTFHSPTGETYSPTSDPIQNLRYEPSLSAPVVTAVNALTAAAQQKGSSLVAKEILPITSGLSHQDTKTALLLSDPKTLSSYARVVSGTTTVTPTPKGTTVLKPQSSGAAQRAAAEAAARGIKTIESTGKWKAV